jgi:hypothetical protein
MVVEQAARLMNEVATGVSRPGELMQGGDRRAYRPCVVSGVSTGSTTGGVAAPA